MSPAPLAHMVPSGFGPSLARAPSSTSGPGGWPPRGHFSPSLVSVTICHRNNTGLKSARLRPGGARYRPAAIAIGRPAAIGGPAGARGTVLRALLRRPLSGRAHTLPGVYARDAMGAQGAVRSPPIGWPRRGPTVRGYFEHATTWRKRTAALSVGLSPLRHPQRCHIALDRLRPRKKGPWIKATEHKTTEM